MTSSPTPSTAALSSTARIGVAFTYIAFLYALSLWFLGAAFLGQVIATDEGRLGRWIREEPASRPARSPPRRGTASRRLTEAVRTTASFRLRDDLPRAQWTTLTERLST